MPRHVIGDARPGLAQEYLRMFAVGLTSARALFAKRRMGKSEFLEKDLIPAAQAGRDLMRHQVPGRGLAL